MTEKGPYRSPAGAPRPGIEFVPDHKAAEREMCELERQMYAMAYDDPERQKVVDRYNAVCDELGVPSGDK